MARWELRVPAGMCLYLTCVQPATDCSRRWSGEIYQRSIVPLFKSRKSKQHLRTCVRRLQAGGQAFLFGH